MVSHIWRIKAGDLPETAERYLDGLFRSLISARLSPPVYWKWAYSLNLFQSPAHSRPHSFLIITAFCQTGWETFHTGFTPSRGTTSKASPKWCIKLARPCMGDDPVGLHLDGRHPCQSPQCIDRRDKFSSLGVEGCLLLNGAQGAGENDMHPLSRTAGQEPPDH